MTLSGREFAMIRRQLRLTQVALADRLDCSSAYISRIENSAEAPPLAVYALFGIRDTMLARVDEAA